MIIVTYESTSDQKPTELYKCFLLLSKLFLDLDEMQNRMNILSIVLGITEVI